MMAKDVMPEEMRYRAQDAMHTIARAESHKRDPELMKHVRALAQDVHKAVGGEKGAPARTKDPAKAAGKVKGSVVAKAQKPQAKAKNPLSPVPPKK